MAKIETAEVGQIVYWFPDNNPDQTPHPAVVMSVGSSGLALHLMEPESRAFARKDGVRHIHDPEANRFEIHDGGCWQHSPHTRRVLELLAMMDDPKPKTEKGK